MLNGSHRVKHSPQTFMKRQCIDHIDTQPQPTLIRLLRKNPAQLTIYTPTTRKIEKASAKKRGSEKNIS